jgi:hypothetical protein
MEDHAKMSRSILIVEQEMVRVKIADIMDPLLDLSEELYAYEIGKDKLYGVDAIGMVRGAIKLLEEVGRIYERAITQAEDE